MTGKYKTPMRWTFKATVCAVLVFGLLLGTGCGLDLCKIFNCNTFFFLKDLSGGSAGNGTDGSASDGQTDMNMGDGTSMDGGMSDSQDTMDAGDGHTH